MHEGVWLKKVTKRQLLELRLFFHKKGFVYAWKVPSWAN